MERISTDIGEVLKIAKIEICSFDLRADDMVIAYFSEFPAIGSPPFKIVFIENAKGKIRSEYRQWDSEYNLIIWSNGVYNLDRLRIISEEKDLTEGDLALLKKLLSHLQRAELPKTIQKEKAVVLDGADWEFGIVLGNKKVDYKWSVPIDKIELFAPLIELMKKQHL